MKFLFVHIGALDHVFKTALAGWTGTVDYFYTLTYKHTHHLHQRQLQTGPVMNGYL